MPQQQTQGAAYRPPLLDLKQVAKLCDAAMYAFSVLADAEREAKKAVHTQLKAEMNKVDLFGLTANRADSEAREYQPDDDRGWYS